MEDMEPLKACRICKNTSLIKYLDLGKTPLANAIVKKDDIDKEEKTFPLEVMYCPQCHLSQLSVIVNPKIMFSNYPYRSSISKTFIEHCKEIAEIFKKSFDFKENNLVIDIASNDGCMLQQFKEMNFKVLGIDPATNLADIANNNGIETINKFWSIPIAQDILNTKGHAKIITATNVFAHVNDLNEFVEGVKTVLDKDGIFMIEAPHALQMIKHTEFDTIYHEHLSYLLINPLKHLFTEHEMRIFRVDETPIHGGTIRVFVCHNNAEHTKEASVDKIIEQEKNETLYNIEGYNEFSKRVEKTKKDLLELLDEIKKEGKKVAAYGASAKGNTLLNYFNIKSDNIEFIADDTPEKQNHFAPGSHIPILESSAIERENPDYLMLLAWNFAKELIRKTSDFEEKGGKYIVPVPEVKVVTSKDYE